MNQTYRHSGKFAPIGLVIGILAGLAAALPLAWIYAWGIIEIDEQRMAVIATLCYGAAVGAAAGYGLKLGKVRNAKVASVLAALVAAVSLYCSWAFWVENILARFQQEDVDAFALMMHPQALWNLVKAINQYGTWGTTKDNLTKGVELWGIWGLEALAVLAFAAGTAYLVLEMQPFCEKCQRWCGSSEKLCISDGNPTFIRQSLFKRDMTFLEKLGPGNKKASHITAQLHSCSSCGDLNTLTLTQTSMTQTSKWQKPKVKNTELVKKFLLSRLEADAFRNTAHNVKQLAKAAKA